MMTIFPEHFAQERLLEHVDVADEITLILRATSPTASCPDCGTVSTRTHSHYRRIVHDLPSRGCLVHVILNVRRFRCQKSTCARKIFAEPFPTFVQPHAQRSIRLQEALRQIGMTLGGQAGTRLGTELGFSGSRDTILRLVRAAELPPMAMPKKVGVDDWVWKRGHRYGTLVCDLERGIPIDVLPERTVESVIAWLEAHHTVNPFVRNKSLTLVVEAI